MDVTVCRQTSQPPTASLCDDIPWSVLYKAEGSIGGSVCPNVQGTRRESFDYTYMQKCAALRSAQGTVYATLARQIGLHRCL